MKIKGLRKAFTESSYGDYGRIYLNVATGELYGFSYSSENEYHTFRNCEIVLLTSFYNANSIFYNKADKMKMKDIKNLASMRLVC